MKIFQKTWVAIAVTAVMIAADIGISVDGEAAVYSDAKLLVFILKQLLINCAKYCPDCRVRMELSENGLSCRGQKDLAPHE